MGNEEQDRFVLFRTRVFVDSGGVCKCGQPLTASFASIVLVEGLGSRVRARIWEGFQGVEAMGLGPVECKAFSAWACFDCSCMKAEAEPSPPPPSSGFWVCSLGRSTHESHEALLNHGWLKA